MNEEEYKVVKNLLLNLSEWDLIQRFTFLSRSCPDLYVLTDRVLKTKQSIKILTVRLMEMIKLEFSSRNNN